MYGNSSQAQSTLTSYGASTTRLASPEADRPLEPLCCLVTVTRSQRPACIIDPATAQISEIIHLLYVVKLICSSKNESMYESPDPLPPEHGSSWR